MGRTPCCSSPGQKKGPWTPEEDHLLTKYIETHGEGQWRTLPKKAGLKRCGKGCRLRWMNYLRPNVKRGNISTEEEELIVRLHKLLGNRWSLIAGRVPGRTDNEIKNYWNTHLSKKIRCNDIAPTINSKSSTHFLSNVGDIKVFQRNGDLETNALFNVPFAFDQMNTMNQKQHCPPALHLNTSNALNGNSLVYDEHEVQYYSCGAGDLLNSDIFHESCILLNPMDVMSQINKPHQADIRVGETHNITDSQQCYLDSSPSYYTDPQHCHTITHDPAWTLFLGDLASSQQPPTITASGSNESSFDLKQQYLSSSIHGTDRCSHAVEETDSILREFHSQDLGYTADQFLYRNFNDESIICNAGNSLLGCSDDILNSYRNALCGESQAQQNAVEMQSLELILGNCFGQFLNSMYS